MYFQEYFIRQRWRPFLIEDANLTVGDGRQGEHLPRFVRLFYNPVVRLGSRFLMLLIWLSIAYGVYVGAYWSVSQVGFYVNPSPRDSGIADVNSPVPPNKLPDPTTEADFPSSKAVSESAKLPLENTVLFYRNNSGRNLRLLVYDCAMFYAATRDKNDEITRSHFRDWPFVATGSKVAEERFSRFPKDSNWYAFYVYDIANSKSHLVGFYDLTQRKRWRLLIQVNGQAVSGDMSYE